MNLKIITQIPKKFGSWYDATLRRRPLLTRMVTTFIITGAADFSSQLIKKYRSEREENELYPIFSLKYATCCGMINAPWMHFYYTLLIDRVVPGTGTIVLLIKLACDTFLYSPAFCHYMCFLIAKLNGSTNKEAKRKMRENYWLTQVLSWKIWPIASLINYAFLPVRYRVLFLNMASFLWAILFCFKNSNPGSGKGDYSDKDIAEVVANAP
ncbi:unnamed protein product [Moneuplotes crassus]|uniref:Uncharacterized protein n=1 Tax=Euplotes crassus TaxID=5936 RepID=A0AAD1XR93_EUPCR|nr:unnamed protein product [Moneuplotes crassus]